MAKLPQATGGTGLQIAELTPAGQHIAVCMRISDQFGVERPKFENPIEKEVTDVTRFVFGLFGQDRKIYFVQTYEFNISGAPGANLMKFLKGWLGQDPRIGWDYVEMLGKGVMLTIQHKESKKKAGQWYSNIVSASPVHPQLQASVPDPKLLEAALVVIERASAQPSNAPAGGPPLPPGPTTPYPPTPQHHAPATRQDVLPPPKTISPDGKYELVNGAWVPVQAAPPPPPAPPAPPPPPAYPPVNPPPPPPPPPPPAAKKIYVAINGAATEMQPAAIAHLVATGGGDTPAILEGETTWKTAKDFVAKTPGSPLPYPPRPAGTDEDVPF